MVGPIFELTLFPAVQNGVAAAAGIQRSLCGATLSAKRHTVRLMRWPMRRLTFWVAVKTQVANADPSITRNHLAAAVTESGSGGNFAFVNVPNVLRNNQKWFRQIIGDPRRIALVGW